MSDTAVVTDRRTTQRTDRRKHSRSGRRATDPQTNWRRVAWLFAAYAAYLSIRSLPANVKNLFKRLRKKGVDTAG